MEKTLNPNAGSSGALRVQATFRRQSTPFKYQGVLLAFYNSLAHVESFVKTRPELDRLVGTCRKNWCLQRSDPNVGDF